MEPQHLTQDSFGQARHGLHLLLFFKRLRVKVQVDALKLAYKLIPYQALETAECVFLK